MPSTPETCSSMGAATVSRTVWALAPGYRAVTSTVGGVTSGYCATGRVNTATPPASTKMTEMTVAKIGRSIKNLEIPPRRLLRSRPLPTCHATLLPHRPDRHVEPHHRQDGEHPGGRPQHDRPGELNHPGRPEQEGRRQPEDPTQHRGQDPAGGHGNGR